LYEPRSYFIEDVMKNVDEDERLFSRGALKDYLMDSCNQSCSVRCPRRCTELVDKCHVPFDKFLFAFLPNVKKPTAELSIHRVCFGLHSAQKHQITTI